MFLLIYTEVEDMYCPCDDHSVYTTSYADSAISVLNRLY